MKSKVLYISTLVRFVIFSIAVSGCSQTQITGSANDKILREYIPSKNVHVINVNSLTPAKK